MPLIPQSVAGEVLMDFDSLKAAQSGLGTVCIRPCLCSASDMLSHVLTFAMLLCINWSTMPCRQRSSSWTRARMSLMPLPGVRPCRTMLSQSSTTLMHLLNNRDVMLPALCHLQAIVLLQARVVRAVHAVPRGQRLVSISPLRWCSSVICESTTV